jgi:hypothetical protein
LPEIAVSRARRPRRRNERRGLTPFGKHKGTPLADLELSYLLWLDKQALRDPLMRQVAEEIARRRAIVPGSTQPESNGDEPELLPDALRGGAPVRFRTRDPWADPDDDRQGESV